MWKNRSEKARQRSKPREIHRFETRTRVERGTRHGGGGVDNWREDTVSGKEFYWGGKMMKASPGHTEADGIIQIYKQSYSQPFSRKKQGAIHFNFPACCRSQTHKREVVFPINSLTMTIKYRFTHQAIRPGVSPLKENKISSVPTIKPLISFGQVTADNG